MGVLLYLAQLKCFYWECNTYFHSYNKIQNEIITRSISNSSNPNHDMNLQVGIKETSYSK